LPGRAPFAGSISDLPSARHSQPAERQTSESRACRPSTIFFAATTLTATFKLISPVGKVSEAKATFTYSCR
jgi:hypothetical protein